MKKITKRSLWALALVSVLFTGVARAQDVQQPRATAPPNNPDQAGAMAAAIGQMIGGAEFMLILDKPFEAEKLFGAILSMDPNNAYAKQGLERVKVAKRPNWTFLVHPFTFPKLDQSMFTYGGGPSFYSKNLKSTFWIGDGWYKNNIDPNNPDNPLGFLGYQIGTADDAALRKQTYNVILEPYYKQFDGYFFLNRTVYQEAPDRWLFFGKATWNRQFGRESYSLSGGQHDSYFQNDLAQFFAPESWTAVQQKILSREVGAAATHPFGRFIDTSASFQYFDYTDGNNRKMVRLQGMYRILPHEGKQMPIFRAGVSYLYDDGDFAALYYYIPLNYHHVQISADYTFVAGNTRYGIYGNIPVTGESGTGFGRFNPPYTTYMFINRKLNAKNEIWGKYAGLSIKNNGPAFGDWVFGFNTRF